MRKNPSQTGSERISPTAFYTGHVWYRNGLAPQAFYNPQGHILFSVVQPAVRVASRFNGGLKPEVFILQRHKLIDHLLCHAIENRGVETVVEIAAGLSARGYRFKKKYGDRIEYIEADLPGMVAKKCRVLEKTGVSFRNHKVVAVDVKATSGPLSI